MKVIPNSQDPDLINEKEEKENIKEIELSKIRGKNEKRRKTILMNFFDLLFCVLGENCSWTIEISSWRKDTGYAFNQDEPRKKSEIESYKN